MAISQALLQWFQKQQESLLHQPSAIFLILIFTLFFLIFINSVWSAKPDNLPPSPPKFPIIGHLHLIGKAPHRSFHALSEKYGPIMLLRLPKPSLIVSSAEIAEHIMKTHDMVFANRPVTSGSKAFFYGDQDMGFASYSEYWREMRKLFVNDLLTTKRRQAFKLARDEEIENMVGKIKQFSSVGSGEAAVNVSEMVAVVINNLLTRVSIGRSSWMAAKYADVPRQITELLGTFTFEDVFPSLGWIDVLTGIDGRMKRVGKLAHKFMDEVLDHHLNSSKADEETMDFVDTLIAYQRDPKSQIQLSQNSVRALLLDMFVGGNDMLNTSMDWLMTLVYNHPDVMKKLQEELRRIIGKKPKIEESDINQMDYLHMVIKETLRLHPPTSLLTPRVSSTSTTIDGYHVPAKMNVYVNAWAIARDPKKWDRPDEFIPERFIDNPADFRSHDFEFIPFGSGRRICPAISFATLAMGSIAANLLHWFDWKLPNDAEDTKLDMKADPGATLHKKYPVCLVPVSHTF